MQYQIYRPASGLLPFIKYYWSLYEAASAQQGQWELFIPDGQSEIIFNRQSSYGRKNAGKGQPQTVTGSTLVGQRQVPVLTRRQGKTRLFGVKLKPGALYLLSGQAEKAFAGQLLSLNTVALPGLQALEEAVFSASDDVQRVALLDQFFSGKLLRHPALADVELFGRLLALTGQGDALFSVSGLQQASGLHPKKLERLFARFTGLSPKSYLKISRFKQAYKRFNRNHASFYTSDIYELGYYDQTHFIKEFRLFARQTPTNYYGRQSAVTDDILLRTLQQLRHPGQ